MTGKNKVSKELDSFFTGVGLAIACFAVSVVLFFNSDYFGSVLATNIALIIFLILGIVGLNTEIEKYTKSH